MLPTVMGAAVGFGVATAVWFWPGGTPVAAGGAGVALGLLAAGAFRLLPRHLDMTDGQMVDDDGSGERRVWSTRETEQLAPHNAWITAPDERGFLASDTAEVPAPVVAKPDLDKTVVYDVTGFDFRLRRPKGKRRAGVR